MLTCLMLFLEYHTLEECESLGFSLAKALMRMKVSEYCKWGYFCFRKTCVTTLVEHKTILRLPYKMQVFMLICRQRSLIVETSADISPNNCPLLFLSFFFVGDLRAILKWCGWLKSSCPDHISQLFISLHYWPTQSKKKREKRRRKMKRNYKLNVFSSLQKLIRNVWNARGGNNILAFPCPIWIINRLL